MKILILAPIQHDFPPVGYGPWELVSYNLAETLADKGVDVTVYATKKAKTKAKLLSCWDEPVSEKELGKFSANLIHITEALKIAKDFDIIHSHLNIHPALFSKFTTGVKMVTTLHASGSEKDKEPLFHYLKDENYVSISYAERKFAPYLNYIANVYNGVDFSKYQISQKSGKYLLFSGRIIPDKGIEEAMEFAEKSGIPLKIAGLITDNDYFDIKVKPHIGENVEYVGNLAYPEYSEVLRSAKALLSFIRWNEPFGLSHIDALASGIPVIGFKKGALPEIVYDKRMGILTDTLTEALALIDSLDEFDPKVIRDLAFERFSREKMAEGYLKVYENLLKND